MDCIGSFFTGCLLTGLERREGGKLDGKSKESRKESAKIKPPPVFFLLTSYVFYDDEVSREQRRVPKESCEDSGLGK